MNAPTASRTLDVDHARSLFPFCSSGLDRWGLFDNAGGTLACNAVIDRLTRFYRERKVQPYSAYDASRLGGEEMDEARARMAALLGVEFDELSFGPSTTQNTYVLAQAFAEMMQPGQAIVVTNQDHEANSGPWRRLAARGFELREWQINPDTGHLDPQDLENLLDENVRLVCFPHCSNVVGEVNPVIEITALAHAAGAFVCVDGVSYAPHGFVDVGAVAGKAERPLQVIGGEAEVRVPGDLLRGPCRRRSLGGWCDRFDGGLRGLGRGLRGLGRRRRSWPTPCGGPRRSRATRRRTPSTCPFRRRRTTPPCRRHSSRPPTGSRPKTSPATWRP